MAAKISKIYADEWNYLPWKLFQRQVFRLQHRIYEASKRGDRSLIKKLQTLLLVSKCSKYLAIDNITQYNIKKNKLGLVNFYKNEEFLFLLNDLNITKVWKQQKLLKLDRFTNKYKKVYAPTIRDRCIHRLIELAVDPIYKNYFSKKNYNIRNIDLLWNIQRQIFNNFNVKETICNKKVLLVNLEHCFNTTDYKNLLSGIILPNNAKTFLYSAFKFGLFKQTNVNLHLMIKETGFSIFSLCDFLLYGIEDINNQKVTTNYKLNNKGLLYQRNVLFILDNSDSPIKLVQKIQVFLKKRGLNQCRIKKLLVSCQEGFNFLDWHFVVKRNNSSLFCYPSQSSIQKLVTRIKRICKNSKYKLIKRLEIAKYTYYNWLIYHQYCNLSKVSVSLWSLRRWTYKYLKKNSNISKQERIYYVHMTFGKSKFLTSQSSIKAIGKSIYTQFNMI